MVDDQANEKHKASNISSELIAGSQIAFEQMTKDYDITKFQVKDLIPVVPASGQF